MKKHDGVSIYILTAFPVNALSGFCIETRLMSKVSLTGITVISYKIHIATKIRPFLDIQSGHLAPTQKYKSPVLQNKLLPL